MAQTSFSGPVASQNGFIDSSFTTAERDDIVDPHSGLLVYNTDINEYEVYNGLTWQPAFAPAVLDFNWSLGANYSEAEYQSGTLYITLDGFPSSVGTLLQIPSGTSITFGGSARTMINSFSLIFGNKYGCYIGDPGSEFFITPISWSQTRVPSVTPVINSNGLSPSYAGIAGGGTVSVYGENFATATQVRIDGVSTEFIVENDASLFVPSVPAHAEGPVDLTVTNPAGTSNAQTFTYIGAPTVLSISPSSGSELGGTSVTITVTNVTMPDGLNLQASIEIGGTATPYDTIDNNVITATTQAHVPDVGVNVEVITEYGASEPNTLFTYTAE